MILLRLEREALHWSPANTSWNVGERREDEVELTEVYLELAVTVVIAMVKYV